jgi:hypothetical protein
MVSTFTDCYSPSEEMSLTNHVYVNPDDYDSEFMEIGEFPYHVSTCSNVPTGFIALNAVQRRAVGRRAGEPVEVTYMQRDFQTADSLVFSLETLKPPHRTLRMNNASLQALFEDEYQDCVFTKGQKHFFIYGDTTIIATCMTDGSNIVTDDTVFQFISSNDIDLI